MKTADTVEKYLISVIRLYRRYCLHRSYCRGKKLLRINGIPMPPLTEEQKQQIRDLWAPKGPYNMDTHKLIYWSTGKFDPRIVPDKFIRLKLEPELNDQLKKYAWADKNIFDMVLGPGHTPKTIFRNMGGVLCDEDYEPLTPEQAAQRLQSFGKGFYKPAQDTGHGKGARILEKLDREILKELGENYVVQQWQPIHPAIKKLNGSSVTVIRMNTFFIHGRSVMTSAAARVGLEGEATNYTPTKDGHGILIIGIDENGRLRKTGHLQSGAERDTTDNGFRFGGMEIPGYEKAVEMVTQLHKRLPYHRFVGWDITIDEHERPVVVEYNIKGPAALSFQRENGTLFGSYFDEIYNAL